MPGTEELRLYGHKIIAKHINFVFFIVFKILYFLLVLLKHWILKGILHLNMPQKGIVSAMECADFI